MGPPPIPLKALTRHGCIKPCDRAGRRCRAENDRGIGLCPLLCGCAQLGGGARSMVDYALGVSAALFDLEATRAVGILLIVAGLPGLVDLFARFALQGLGTPAPIAPTQNLVVTGLYRYVRNPYSTLPLSPSSAKRPCSATSAFFLYGVLVWLAFHAFVVGYEEPALVHRFGTGYEGFPGQRPALDFAAHALASRTTLESFVTSALPREGRGSCSGAQ